LVQSFAEFHADVAGIPVVTVEHVVFEIFLLEEFVCIVGELIPVWKNVFLADEFIRTAWQSHDAYSVVNRSDCLATFELACIYVHLYVLDSGQVFGQLKDVCDLSAGIRSAKDRFRVNVTVDAEVGDVSDC